ncbi:ABC transporter permease [Tissierella carlieri]|uniref:ABC transporter permease n=1 Tax=Tissierella carlieri TaxID=689904 RepID=UPI001C11A960|nr:ABC transporter permease [Tissierella carlieri]MBU5310409.1 ABC transporter permease [Tissierella carlieri]
MLRIIWKMTLRRLNPLLKNPIAIIISMFQSIIWLVLFGNLFSSGTKISGFEYNSYIAYMLPSIIIMNVLFIGIYLGLGTISDLQSGVLQRFLVAPIGRLSIVFSDLLYLIALQLIQSVILILISLLMGTRLPLGLWGGLLYIVVPIIFAMAVGSLSISTALITKKHESMINVMQFCSMPLMFLSSAFMSKELMPKWISWISRINPVDWAISLERAVVNNHGVIPYTIALFVFVIVSVGFCVYSFNLYRHSI